MSVQHAPFEQSVCFFPCTDLDTTQAFYEGKLGLPLVLDQGACRIFRVSTGGFIGFCTHRDKATAEGAIITLATRAVERVYAQLLERGVTFEAPLKHNERFNITHAFLRDPDGHLVEIQRFDDPRWPQAK